MIRYYWGGVYILIINQLLPIALFIALPSFQAGDLIQLLGISGATIAFGFRDILENLLAGILIVFDCTCRRIQTRDSSREQPKILDFCSMSQIHQWSKSKISGVN
ncbi:mechanosensitive ion channel [Microcoleus sp. FACHB-45]|nr:mechanosensitive ion channel [Microcoleus sp. FACHB-84]MBD2011013.1 mechanosensitive ion channel [Microcoleus sp. FACHB-45]